MKAEQLPTYPPLPPVKWHHDKLCDGYAVYGVFFRGYYLGCWTMNGVDAERARRNGLEIEES